MVINHSTRGVNTRSSSVLPRVESHLILKGEEKKKYFSRQIVSSVASICIHRVTLYQLLEKEIGFLKEFLFLLTFKKLKS